MNKQGDTVVNQSDEVKNLSFQVVTAPLSIEQIKSYFENKNQLFVIDYKNSQIKGGMLLTYISNLELPCEIDFKDVSKEEIYDLIAAYFETKSIVSTEILHIIAAKILLESKGIDSEYLDCGKIFDRNDVKYFIEKNQEIVSKWNSFVSSSFYFFLFCYRDLAEQHGVKNDFPEVNDPDYVGYNIVKLFSIPGFLETYYSVPISHSVHYFKPQFDDYIFKGKNLFQYFINPNNILAIALDDVFRGNISTDTLNKALVVDN